MAENFSATDKLAKCILAGETASLEIVEEMINVSLEAASNGDSGSALLMNNLVQLAVHYAKSGGFADTKLTQSLNDVNGPAETLLVSALANEIFGNPRSFPPLESVCNHLSTPSKFLLISASLESMRQFLTEWSIDKMSQPASMPKNFDHPEVAEVFARLEEVLALLNTSESHLIEAAMSGSEYPAFQAVTKKVEAAQLELLEELQSSIKRDGPECDNVRRELRSLCSSILKCGKTPRVEEQFADLFSELAMEQALLVSSVIDNSRDLPAI